MLPQNRGRHNTGVGASLCLLWNRRIASRSLLLRCDRWSVFNVDWYNLIRRKNVGRPSGARESEQREARHGGCG